MPANAVIQNATSHQGLSFSSHPQRYPDFTGKVGILRRLVVSHWISAFAGMTNRASPDRFLLVLLAQRSNPGAA